MVERGPLIQRLHRTYGVTIFLNCTLEISSLPDQNQHNTFLLISLGTSCYAHVDVSNQGTWGRGNIPETGQIVVINDIIFHGSIKR